jgi:protein SCO1/2
VGWKSLAFTALVSFVSVSYYQIKKDEQLSTTISKVTSSGTPDLGGPWTLIDVDTGRLVTDTSVLGSDSSKGYTLMYFGFANCPDICPSELTKVAQVLDSLKASHPSIYSRITPIFVTVDPGRDSIKRLRTYRQDFHPKIKFLTGTEEMVRNVAKLYRVYISKADETADGDYLLDHSIVLYFNGPTKNNKAGEGGKEGFGFIDFFTQSMKARDMVKRIVAHVETK